MSIIAMIHLLPTIKHLISMKNTCKICWIILGLFLLGNIILLSVWWLNDKRENKMDVRRFSREDHRMQMRDNLLQNTNINEAQFDEMYDLWQKHGKRMYQCQMELDSLRQQLMNETFSNNTDTLNVNRLLNELSIKQQNIEKVNYQHFRKLRSICETDEQRQMLDELLRTRMMDDGHRKRFRGRRQRH